MPPVQCKGSAPYSTRAWVIREYGKPTWEAILADIAPAHRTWMDSPLSFAWYPIEGFDQLFAAMFTHCVRGDARKADALFRAAGRHIADDNLSTIYKVVLAFAKPDHVISLLPRMWSTYFSGITIDVERPDPKLRAGVCRVRGLRLRYVGPAAAGWIEYAYEKVGCRDARVVEQGFSKGVIVSDDLHYDMRWS